MRVFDGFRVAEQYLIRAEAKAQLGDLKGALEDLNTIRDRAGLADYNSSSQEQIVDEIIHERQIELFSEWGNRWLDLKRTDKVDAVMTDVSSQKGGIWNSFDRLYPIPFLDLQKDPNLVQNPGY